MKDPPAGECCKCFEQPLGLTNETALWAEPFLAADPTGQGRFALTSRNHHLSFGLGIHRCRGAYLAKAIFQEMAR
jgi:cytochrome P450